MPRQLAFVIALLLAAVAGCDDSDTGTPPPRTDAQAAATDPAAPALAPAAPGSAVVGPAAQTPAAQPAPIPVAPAQPLPGPQPPLAGQQPLAGQPGGPAYPNQLSPPGSATAAVFVPFPPFVIAAPPKTAGGLAGINPALPPGPGQFAIGSPPPGGPGFQPPGVNVPGGVPNAERKPQTEIESYEGTELFAVAPNGALAATFAVDSSKRPVVYELKLWNLTTGKSLATLESSDNLRDMAISPDGNLLATVSGAGDTGELTLWELPAGTKKSTHNWNKYGDVSFSSDSSRIVTTVGRKGIAILDLSTGKVKPKPLKNLAKTLTVQASPIEPIVAIGLGVEKRPEEKTAGAGRPGANATPQELDKLRQERQQQQAGQGGGKRKRRKGGAGNGTSAPSPNEIIGLEPGAEGVIQILDLDTLKIRKKLYVTGAPADLAFNARGTVLAALMVGGKGEMWDTASWDEQGGKLGRGAGGAVGVAQPQPGAKPDKPASIESSLLVISPDADWAIARQTPSNRSPADVWDTRAGQSRPLDQSAVSQLGFLPDGTLICAARDKTLRFFELPAITPVYPPFAKR